MTRTLLFRVLLQMALAVMITAPAAAETLAPDSWDFEAYLDDKPIGYHHFSLQRDGDSLVMLSEADFRVRFLFVTAFRYQHNNREVWQDGCLRSIEAQTDSNGKAFEVRGRMEQGQLVLNSNDSKAVLDDCVATFAYWNRDLLTRDRLLNSQTGEYLDVTIEELPRAAYPYGDRQMEAEVLRVLARGVDIELAYSVTGGDWLGLKSTLKNGRTLIYRRKAPGDPERRQVAVLPGNKSR